MKKIGILGGTFDPVHIGHVSIAQQALDKLVLDEIRFIPLNIPPHRDPPIATAKQRTLMLSLALNENPEMNIDRRELDNDTVSYTIHTLQSFREDFPQDSLILLLGDDAFAKIDGWKNWQKILDYAHIVTIKREDDELQDLPYTVNNWMEENLINNPELLHERNHGYIYRLQIDLVDVSSTRVNQHLQQNLPLDDLLSSDVIDYIHTQHLYQS